MKIRKKGLNKRALKKQLRLLPGYVPIVLWTVFTFVVIGWVIFASFSTTPEIFKGEVFRFATGIHLENYVKALIHHKVALYFVNSVWYTIITCFGIIVIAAPASYALSRFRFMGNRLIQALFMAGLGIPGIMIIMPLFTMASGAGMTNSRTVVIILYLGVVLPFSSYYLLTFFQNISGNYAEAAAIDGCGPVKTFWLIMFPLAQPGIVTVTIFNFITVWNEYFISLIFANDTSLRPVAVGLFSMIQSMRYTGDWAGMFAAVVIVFLPSFLLYILLSDKIVGGITAGGIKG